MRTLATIASALTLLAAALIPADASAATPAIVGGTLAQEGTFPQLAFIEDKEPQGRGFCTGTVVAPTVVLTAAHCAEDTETGTVHEASGYSVYTGNVEWPAAPQMSGVSRVVVYPTFNRADLSDDAALLILSTLTSAPAIPLASYPSDSTYLAAGAEARIAGWGETAPKAEVLPARLSWADTVVQGPPYCELMAPPFYSGSEMCTIDPPSDQTGACFGDSGGPLITPPGTGEIELGITSHIYSECLTARPTVFTRADLIAPWVDEWIAAVQPLAPEPVPKPVTAQPPVAQTPAAEAASAPAAVPNTPGYYVTRPSRTRRIMIHVSGGGDDIVGISIKTPVTCQHGHQLPLEDRWLSYSQDVAITNHIARRTLEVPAGRASTAGQLGLFVRFMAAGSLEGRLNVRIPFKSRRMGLCATTLRFTAKT
jgi:secreted trypsin-like serine protease